MTYDIEEPVEQRGAVSEMGGGIVVRQQISIGMAGDNVEPSSTERLRTGGETVDL